MVFLFGVCFSYAGENTSGSNNIYDVGTISVNATADDITFTDIVMDSEKTEISCVLGVNYFKHTATKDGVLVFHPLNYVNVIFYGTDQTGTEETSLTLKHDASYQKYYQADVKSGETYYFKTGMVLDLAKVEVYYNEETSNKGITIESSYKEGDTFSPNGKNLELTIDRKVNIESYKILYGDGESIEIPSENVRTSYYNSFYCVIELTPVIESLIVKDKLAMGDTFMVRLEGITDKNNPEIVYGEDGIFEISLVLGKIPATVVDISPVSGSSINTYYVEGGDAGYIVFTFSEKIKEVTDVSYSFGDVEAGSYVTDKLPYEVEDDKVIVNIQGITFPEKVLTMTSGEVQTVVTIELNDVQTIDGGKVSPNLGTLLGAIYKVEKEEIDFVCDFIPEEGGTIDGLSEIIVWTKTKIFFDGVELAYKDKEGVDKVTEFTSEECPSVYSEDYAGYIITVPLSGIEFGAGDINLTVLNVKLTNGDEKEINATFTTTGSGSGIAEALAADCVVKVYDVNGVFVAEGLVKDVTRNLEKGKVYVINGQKLIVE